MSRAGLCSGARFRCSFGYGIVFCDFVVLVLELNPDVWGRMVFRGSFYCSFGIGFVLRFGFSGFGAGSGCIGSDCASRIRFSRFGCGCVSRDLEFLVLELDLDV